MSTALEQFGPYAQNPAFAEFTDISACSYEIYHSATDAQPRRRPLEDLIARMVYIAETCSVSLRLSSSWALTLPSFSLCRDRYEQTVKFSWLARQKTEDGWLSYVKSLEATKQKLRNSLAQSGIKDVEFLDSDLGSLSGEERAKYQNWQQKPVDQLAAQRDKLKGISGANVDKENLRIFYDSIYRQGSSVTHYDMWAVNMLSLHQNADKLVLAPDPAMPIVLTLHNSLFDIILCVEACAKLGTIGDVSKWNRLYRRWCIALKKTGIAS